MPALSGGLLLAHVVQASDCPCNQISLCSPRCPKVKCFSKIWYDFETNGIPKAADSMGLISNPFATSSVLRKNFIVKYIVPLYICIFYCPVKKMRLADKTRICKWFCTFRTVTTCSRPRLMSTNLPQIKHPLQHKWSGIMSWASLFRKVFLYPNVKFLVLVDSYSAFLSPPR